MFKKSMGMHSSAPESTTQLSAPREQNFTKNEQANGLVLPWKLDAEAPQLLPLIDIEWLAAQPLLPYIVQTIPPQVLYRSLMSYGLDNSIEVIEWIRGPLLEKILDFDLWETQSADLSQDISVDKMLEWMKIWNEIDVGFAADRMLELDEETVVVINSGLFEIKPLGAGDFADDLIPDEFFVTPDRRFGLRLKTENPDAFEITNSYISNLYAKNPRIAGAILGYSAMLVRQESLEEAQRWREGRLADQGFVSRSEALDSLKFKGSEKVLSNLLASAELQKKAKEKRKFPVTFAPDSTDYLHRDPDMVDSIVTILRSVEPEQAVLDMARALGDEQFELLAGDDSDYAPAVVENSDTLQEAAAAMIRLSQRLLAFSNTASLRDENRQKLVLEKALAAISKAKPEIGNELLTRLARVANTFAAGTTRKMDNDGLSRAVFMVRGALNIGLELLLQKNVKLELFEIEINIALEIEDSAIQNAVESLLSAGPEALFQLGWNRLLEVSDKLNQKIKALAPDFSQNLPNYSPAFQLVCEALKARLPLFPLLLEQQNKSSATPELIPFESFYQIELAELFILNFEASVAQEQKA